MTYHSRNVRVDTARFRLLGVKRGFRRKTQDPLVTGRKECTWWYKPCTFEDGNAYSGGNVPCKKKNKKKGEKKHGQ